MTSIVYIKCTNPACHKLNPVYGEVKPGAEHICIFCGQLFNAPSEEAAVTDTKKKDRKKKPVQRTSKPQNRNMRKPVL